MQKRSEKIGSPLLSLNFVIAKSRRASIIHQSELFVGKIVHPTTVLRDHTRFLFCPAGPRRKQLLGHWTTQDESRVLLTAFTLLPLDPWPDTTSGQMLSLRKLG